MRWGAQAVNLPWWPDVGQHVRRGSLLPLAEDLQVSPGDAPLPPPPQPGSGENLTTGALQYAPPGTYTPGSSEFSRLMRSPFFQGRKGVRSISVQPTTGDFTYTIEKATHGALGDLARQVSNLATHLPAGIGSSVKAAQNAADRRQTLLAMLNSLGAGARIGLAAALTRGATPGPGVNPELPVELGGVARMNPGEVLTQVLYENPRLAASPELWKIFGGAVAKRTIPLYAARHPEQLVNLGKRFFGR